MPPDSRCPLLIFRSKCQRLRSNFCLCADVVIPISFDPFPRKLPKVEQLMLQASRIPILIFRSHGQSLRPIIYCFHFSCIRFIVRRFCTRQQCFHISFCVICVVRTAPENRTQYDVFQQDNSDLLMFGFYLASPIFSYHCMFGLWMK